MGNIKIIYAMRVLEAELSVQALQIGEIPRMFNRTITSSFLSQDI